MSAKTMFKWISIYQAAAVLLALISGTVIANEKKFESKNELIAQHITLEDDVPPLDWNEQEIPDIRWDD